ncbi:hypothetical protein QTP88_017880 [Uroleucon formosanum]
MISNWSTWSHNKNTYSGIVLKTYTEVTIAAYRYYGIYDTFLTDFISTLGSVGIVASFFLIPLLLPLAPHTVVYYSLGIYYSGFLEQPQFAPISNIMYLICLKMNTFMYTIVVVFVWLQLFACFTDGSPKKSNKPSAAAQRRSGNGYVDFGAHTGPLGSYGWYADFPANRNN